MQDLKEEERIKPGDTVVTGLGSVTVLKVLPGGFYDLKGRWHTKVLAVAKQCTWLECWHILQWADEHLERLLHSSK